MGVVPVGIFLPVRVLSRLFPRLFRQKLAAVQAAGFLRSFGQDLHHVWSSAVGSRSETVLLPVCMAMAPMIVSQSTGFSS